VVHIHALRSGWGEDRLRDEVLQIGERVTRTLADAAAAGTTPLVAAETLARRRIEQACQSPPPRRRRRATGPRSIAIG
jgi:leucine dehydrogenase